MEVRTKTITEYVAKDGTIFESEDECETYEFYIEDCEKQVTYFFSCLANRVINDLKLDIENQTLLEYMRDYAVHNRINLPNLSELTENYNRSVRAIARERRAR